MAKTPVCGPSVFGTGIICNADHPTRRLRLAGHTVFLNAVAYALATASGCTDEQLDALLDIELGEAEGILVPLYAGQVGQMIVPL